MPIAEAEPNDWQAASMLTRLYAETGDKQGRDAQLAHLVDLHPRAVSPQIARMKQLLIERTFIRAWHSLEPWGSYKTYLFCRVYNTAGGQELRIALGSANFDQPQFAKEHPDLEPLGATLQGAASGERNDLRTAQSRVFDVQIPGERSGRRRFKDHADGAAFAGI
jgi:hypothetical protein